MYIYIWASYHGLQINFKLDSFFKFLDKNIFQHFSITKQIQK